MNHLLRKARLSAGLTQQQLADVIGTCLLSIWRWEHGTLPNLLYRQRLCSFFRTSEKALGFPEQDALSSSVHSLAHVTRIDPALPTLPTPLIGCTALFATIKQEVMHAHQPISLSGLPGIGKTAMLQALAADREVQEAFPDGILWMQLGQNPCVSRQYTRWTLWLQGVPVGSALSQPLNEIASRRIWSERLRETIGTRRLLLLCDDVWQGADLFEECVIGPQCAMVFTTRFPQLARSVRATYHIAELDEDAGLALLTHYASTVVSQHAERLRRLIQSVGGHPLALVLIGLALHIASHTGQLRRVEALVERLMQPAERLHLTFPTTLTHTSACSLFGSIATSEQSLSNEAKAALRLLARHVSACALFHEEELLSQTPIPVQALDQLSDSGLLESNVSGFYRLHPVIADYARLAS